MSERKMGRLGSRLRELSQPSQAVAEPQVETALPQSAPAMPEIARLAEILDKESDALSAGDFEAFRRLQAEKRAAARSAERATRRAEALPDADVAAPQLAALQEAAQRNERVLAGMKEAAARIKAYAIEAIEAKTGDGVYRRGGAVRGLSSASVKGVQVKL